jgi:hypothetical protein
MTRGMDNIRRIVATIEDADVRGNAMVAVEEIARIVEQVRAISTRPATTRAVTREPT